jgi:3-amino-5-hydroxybenzoate synthase
MLAIDGGVPVRTQRFPQWPRSASEREYNALKDVLDSGHWWQSGAGKAGEFESWFAAYQGTRHCVAVTNGTHALELICRGLDIGPGDEVLVPALTFISSASAVSSVGATPVPVDIDPVTYCIDVVDADRKLTKATKAIMPVHLAGQPANMDEVVAFAKGAGIHIIENAAQAIGAEWSGRRVGGYGIAGAFSFQAAKLLTAGEGGAVTTDSEDFAERLSLIANCGRARGKPGYNHVALGSNYRISEFHAALLLSQTQDYKDLLIQRTRQAVRLRRILNDNKGGIPPSVHPSVTRNPWYMYLVRLPDGISSSIDNQRWAEALTAEGVPASPIYPVFYETPIYRQLAPQFSGTCPVAEKAAKEVVWLHHSMLLEDDQGINDIADAFAKLSHWYRD